MVNCVSHLHCKSSHCTHIIVRIALWKTMHLKIRKLEKVCSIILPNLAYSLLFVMLHSLYYWSVGRGVLTRVEGGRGLLIFPLTWPRLPFCCTYEDMVCGEVCNITYTHAIYQYEPSVYVCVVHIHMSL